MRFSRRLSVVILAAVALGAAARGRAASAPRGTVSVFYAASLTHVNEKLIGPSFTRATGYGYQGEAAGSVAIANQIKSRIAQPDVVEFADPAVNRLLMGPSNGNALSWYFTFARSALVVGFDPRSRFAPDFRAAQKHRLPWYRALEQPGLRLGRTDPALDPKGYRALFMARLAGKVDHLRGFERRIFGSPENPKQIFPEEVLVSRLLTGQIDAGIFYLSEVRDLHIPYIALPPQVNLGSLRYSRLYATERVKEHGQVIRGAPILYTISIPSTVSHRAAAEAFVSFVLGRRGRPMMASEGLLPIAVTMHGQRQTVPVKLLRYIRRR